MTRPVSCAAGLNRTLRALKPRLTDNDAALVAAAKSLAAAVDAEPSNASLWREYRQIVTSLAEVGANRDDDDDAEFRRSLLTPVPTKVGDPKIA